MRRVGLFVLLLATLSLTTALASSFEVQADNIESWTMDASISVPDPPVASGSFYMVGAPSNADLVTVEPPSTGGNEKGSFDFTSTDIGTENRAPLSGDKVYYVAWSSDPLPSGLRFDNQKVELHFTRTGGSGQLTAGLFDCVGGAAPETLTASGCVLIAVAQGTGEQIDFGPFTYDNIAPTHELRLKIVNLTDVGSNIQWGYKAQNRSARLVVLAPGAP